ncbi:ArgP/LysG family DNA-binding transcriptional regulator [Galbitalea soli]|uniref:LysR family transcriptional regulator ArgP n=1 Tax=Galbitalea soli TaxID=1268042 RepID=A0A7C9TN09_9MICO|nr:LysR family transcriptional regulator ArgP [Galbitalea soli]NYJ30664.1 LysR family transcriptional regulator (chromosome initiation inhibitor) [Galbitalea soli]
MTVDLAQLRALAAVIDGGSFDAAATTLHLTPSAVSQRIKALETSAGRILVTRGKPATATEAGLPYVTLARQIEALVTEVTRGSETSGPSGQNDGMPVTVPLAINSDSLSTWVLPALARLPHSLSLDLHREDQDHSSRLLRDGTVVAAITTESRPVQGCTVERLGTMRYRPFASAAFAARWFAGGVTAEALAHAPMVVFDRKDTLQDRYLQLRSRRRIDPPRHHVPGSFDFAAAVRLGLGWGMLPDQQSGGAEAAGEIVDLDPAHAIDVVLFWQQWAIRTAAIDLIASVIRDAAREHLV